MSRILSSHDMTTTILLPKIWKSLSEGTLQKLPLHQHDPRPAPPDLWWFLQWHTLGEFVAVWHVWKVSKFPRMASSWTRFGRGTAPFVRSHSAFCLISSRNWWAAPGLWGTLQPEQPRQCFVLHYASLKSKSSHAVSSTSINFASAWVQYFPV